MALISIKNLSLVFDDAETPILHNISFDIPENEFITFLGPSGCGKTTLLRILAGFTYPTTGTVTFEDQDLLAIPANKREINTVFQKYALFPHMTVAENIGYGLKLKGIDKQSIRQEVETFLKLIKLSGYENRSIAQLSGGQQQRVAIARALINKPKVLLLDEPLSALDLKLRQEMQYELKEMQQKLGITFIFVTHDQEEAMTMSDRIIVLNDGEIQQNDTPKMIYRKPKNRFVADFIGDSNVFEGHMVNATTVCFANQEFSCPSTNFEPLTPVDVIIRPENIDFTTHDAKSILTGKVTFCIFKGSHYEIIVENAYQEYVINAFREIAVDKEVGLTFESDDIHVMERQDEA